MMIVIFDDTNQRFYYWKILWCAEDLDDSIFFFLDDSIFKQYFLIKVWIFS